MANLVEQRQSLIDLNLSIIESERVAKPIHERLEEPKSLRKSSPIQVEDAQELDDLNRELNTHIQNKDILCGDLKKLYDELNESYKAFTQKDVILNYRNATWIVRDQSEGKEKKFEAIKQ